MNDVIKQALAFYDIDVKKIDALNEDNDAYRLTDGEDGRFFLKVYGKMNDYDFFLDERTYHSYEQIQAEQEILCALTQSDLGTATPIKNRDGAYVTALAPGPDGEATYATVTSFIDGLAKTLADPPSTEMAYLSGVSAAQLHLESKKRLLPLAIRRLHKRQDYMRKIKGYLSQGVKIGTLTASQYEMVGQCCDTVIDCMDRLDREQDDNVGLVHTDIINGNIVYTESHGTLIDFTRSVYSYYLYDLAEMCLHANFGGAGPELQKAILRGYHSVKALSGYDLFAMQAFFAMFIIIIMANCINSKGNAWMEGVLAWFAKDVHPGLISGKGYLDPSVYEDILR